MFCVSSFSLMMLLSRTVISVLTCSVSREDFYFMKNKTKKLCIEMYRFPEVTVSLGSVFSSGRLCFFIDNPSGLRGGQAAGSEH